MLCKAEGKWVWRWGLGSRRSAMRNWIGEGEIGIAGNVRSFPENAEKVVDLLIYIGLDGIDSLRLYDMTSTRLSRLMRYLTSAACRIVTVHVHLRIMDLGITELHAQRYLKRYAKTSGSHMFTGTKNLIDIDAETKSPIMKDGIEGNRH